MAPEFPLHTWPRSIRYCSTLLMSPNYLGIDDGERIKQESTIGAIDAMAWVHAGIRPTAVFIPIGWGERQPCNPWRSVNFLTDKTQRDPISDQTNFKVLLCRVSHAADRVA